MKMKQIKGFLSWLAVAAWMVVIFLFSGQTGDSSGNTSGQLVRWVISIFYRGYADLPVVEQTEILEVIHLLIRKGAHFTEYAILAMLVANALGQYTLSSLRRWLIPIGVCALYAVSDEIHQYFVPERACRFLDMCIDTAGGAFGTAVFALLNLLGRPMTREE